MSCKIDYKISTLIEIKYLTFTY